MPMDPGTDFPPASSVRSDIFAARGSSDEGIDRRIVLRVPLALMAYEMAVAMAMVINHHRC